MKQYKIIISVIVFAILMTNIDSHASEIDLKHKCAVVDIQNNNGISSQSNKEKVAEIYSLFSAWQDAVKEGDTTKIASLVTEDAEFWTNGAPPLKGRNALEKAFKPFLAKFVFTQNYECYELTLRNDIAFIRGLERNKKIPREGGDAIFTEQRAFSVIRQSKDGKWLFARGMTNLPAANGSKNRKPNKKLQLEAKGVK